MLIFGNTRKGEPTRLVRGFELVADCEPTFIGSPARRRGKLLHASKSALCAWAQQATSSAGRAAAREHHFGLPARTIEFPPGLTVLSGLREDRTTRSRRHGTRWTELEHAITSLGGNIRITARSRTSNRAGRLVGPESLENWQVFRAASRHSQERTLHY